MARIMLEEARRMVCRALEQAGASPSMAVATARALVLAEAQGLSSHGLSRVPQYAAHLRNGRVHGNAEPVVLKRNGAVALVDAQAGLAFPACERALQLAGQLATRHGIALVGVVRSHHAGVLADHLRPLAAQGLVGLAFGNAPAAMPVAGGKRPLLGTNPIAVAFPRRDADPLIIDLSLSEVARGKLMVAAKAGRQIPLGWALDVDGNPTTDPQAGMDGSMLPMGSSTSSKGALLAMTVELLVTALIGARFSFEASSFFVDEGNQPGLGQTFLAIDPGALAGRDAFLDRLEAFILEMQKDDGVRLPGARREALRRVAMEEGVEVPDALLAILCAY